MALFAVLVFYTGVFFFDFRPQFAQRRQRKGIWVYILLMLTSFVLLLLTAMEIPVPIYRLFFSQ